MTSVAAFLVAAALVSPFAFVTFRRLWRERRARLAAATPQPSDPTEAAPRTDLADVAADIATIVQAHREALPSEPLDLVVPVATIGGRVAAPEVVQAVIVDDLRRRGLRVEVIGDTFHIDG